METGGDLERVGKNVYTATVSKLKELKENMVITNSVMQMTKQNHVVISESERYYMKWSIYWKALDKTDAEEVKSVAT